MEGPKHDWVWMCFRSPENEGKLRYLVGDGEEAWLVEVEWPEGIDWTNGMREIEKK